MSFNDLMKYFNESKLKLYHKFYLFLIHFFSFFLRLILKLKSLFIFLLKVHIFLKLVFTIIIHIFLLLEFLI